MKTWLWVIAAFGAFCFLGLVPWCILAQNGGHGFDGAHGFDGVVDRLEQQYHVHATRIPLMALASFASDVASHGGVNDVHVARFEHFDQPADGEALKEIASEELGPDWKRIIRDMSNRGRKETLIFAHPEGSRMGIFVLDVDDRELNVVQVSVNPDHLSQTIAQYDHRDAGWSN